VHSRETQPVRSGTVPAGILHILSIPSVGINAKVGWSAVAASYGGYLAKYLKQLGEPRIDLSRLAQKLARGNEIVRTYYYHCMPYQSSPPTEDERRRMSGMRRFVHSLQRSPRFEVRLGRLARTYDGQGRPIFVQKRVDVLLAVDLVRMSSGRQIEYAYILAGDSDLVPATQVAKDQGVVVGLYHKSGTAHDELLQTVDESYMLSPDFFDMCLQGM